MCRGWLSWPSCSLVALLEFLFQADDAGGEHLLYVYVSQIEQIAAEL